MPELKMKPDYKMFFLDNDDFDNLYKDLPYMTKDKLKDSMGFANPKTGEAYVRKTGVAELDDITIEHEFQELLAKTSPDEIDGIRYKKVFKEIIAPYVLPIVGAALGGPLIGGLLKGAGLGATMASTIGSAIGGAGASAIGQAGTTGKVEALPTILSGVGGGIYGAGAAPGIAASAAKEGGLLGQTLTGFKSAIGMPITSAAATPAAAAGTSGAIGTTLPSGAQITPFFPGQTAAQVAANPIYGTGSSILGSALGTGIGSTLAPVTPTISTTPSVAGQVAPTIAPTTTTAVATPFNLKSLATPQNILGAGSLLASTGVKQPEFKMPESVEAIRSKLLQTGAEGGLTEVGQQARLELGNIMKATPTELYPTATDEYYNAALRRTRESYAQAQKQLDAAYNVAGVYGSGEHLAEKAKLQENLARTESALAAETEQRRFELARNAQYQAIQTSLGVDKDVMDDLVGLTGLDVQTAAMMYGAQTADVQSIREALGTLGVELLVRGTTGKGMQTGGININLGR